MGGVGLREGIEVKRTGKLKFSTPSSIQISYLASAVFKAQKASGIEQINEINNSNTTQLR